MLLDHARFVDHRVVTVAHSLVVQDYNFQSHPSEIEGSFSAEDESAVVQGTLQWAYGTAAMTVEKLNDTTYGADITTWVSVDVPPPRQATLATQISNVAARVSLPFLMHHNVFYFLNVKAQNRLGFWGAAGSKGVLIDLIPPFPAPLVDPDRCSQYWFDFYNRSDVMENLIHQGNYTASVSGCENQDDRMLTEYCKPTTIVDWQTDRLKGRCIGPTYLPNHRQLVDSGTVTNGDIPNGIHKLWQLEQTFFSMNWCAIGLHCLLHLWSLPLSLNPFMVWSQLCCCSNCLN